MRLDDAPVLQTLANCALAVAEAQNLQALTVRSLRADGLRVQLGAGQILRLRLPHDDGDARYDPALVMHWFIGADLVTSDTRDEVTVMTPCCHWR